MLCIVLLSAACDSNPAAPRPGGLDSLNIAPRETCSLPLNQVVDSAAKDAIPALTNPTLVNADAVDYLNDDDRVLGIEIGARAIAVPHNILWWHEIVNFDFAEQALAVTYCPLTGSGLVFDRSDAAGAAFGVSGLLFKNNLIMYDRATNESLWPQMARGAQCGPSDGTMLFTYPALEMTWQGWRTLHPATKVISPATSYARNYTENPYGNYDEPDNARLLYDMPIDTRRAPKERVLGLPSAAGGLAFPFHALNDGGPARVVHINDGQPLVVFWDRASQAAMAYRLPTDATAQTFEVRDGALFDLETGSRWRIDGRAVAGPLRGQRLQPVRDAYVAFWFAWAAFQPETALWTGDETTQASYLNNGLKTGTSPTDRMRFNLRTHHLFGLHTHHLFDLHTHHLFPALVASSRYRNYTPAHIWWVSEDIFYHKLPLQPLLGGETARSVFSPV